MVRCTVDNAGEVEGTEVVQLYLGFPGPNAAADGGKEEDRDTPIRQLRGFERVGPIAPGDRQSVELTLTRRDMSVWDVLAQQWRVRRGTYKIWVGASSRDLRLEGSLTIT